MLGALLTVFLPLEMFIIILTYLSTGDNRQVSYVNNEMRDLLVQMNFLKYEKFNKGTLERYCSDPSFRNNVEGKLLSASLYNTLYVDVSALSTVHRVTVHRVTGVTDVSALSSVHTLTLELMDGVTDVSIPGVRDVSALSTVDTLSLTNMRGVTDVSALSTVDTLSLSYMDGVTDVSALSSVHTLTLRNMRGVTDVSALSSVHTLTLINKGWK